MDRDIILTIMSVVGSLMAGAVSGFFVVSYRLGIYKEKVDQLERNNLHGRLCSLEGRFDEGKSLDKYLQANIPINLTQEGIRKNILQSNLRDPIIGFFFI